MEISYLITPELPEESALHKLGQLISQKKKINENCPFTVHQQQLFVKGYYCWRKGSIYFSVKRIEEIAG